MEGREFEGAIGCGKVEEEAHMMETPSIIHFVLVHGFGLGGWCWFKIRCLLEKSGYKVSCPDLKSAGTDLTHPDSVHSFDDYNKPLIDLLSSLPDNEKVILVGHSAGGLSVTHAVHKFGEKIHVSIYVGAIMLRCGFWTEQDYKDGVPVTDASEYDDIKDLELELQGSDQPSTRSIIMREIKRKIAYHMCPLEDSTLASMLVKPGALEAMKDAKFSENPDKDIDKVRRVYIKTMYDRVLKPEQQEAMIQRWLPSNVFVLESDHHPVFSTPLDLFRILVQIVN